MGDEFQYAEAILAKKDALCIASNKNIVIAKGQCGGRAKVFRCSDCDVFKLRLNRGRVDNTWRVTEVNLEHGKMMDGFTVLCTGISKIRPRFVVNSKQFKSITLQSKMTLTVFATRNVGNTMSIICVMILRQSCWQDAYINCVH